MVTGEDRGVAPVIGFILIFSFLVIAFSIYQGAIIPEQNKQAEFQHNERAQGQLLNLQDSIRRTGTTGVSQSVSIQVGADYPDRTLGVNFAVTGGRVSTVKPNPDGANDITFENVRAVRPEVRDYWNSSDPNTTLAFPTKDIVYRPTYTRYNNAPETVFSNTGVFNQFGEANLSIADQILIQGNRITIVAINGSLDQARTGEGASVSVDTEPLSVATNSVTVESDGGGDLTLTVPTSVADESAWNESSLGEQDAVKDTTVNGNELTITLEDRTYSLRMAKVGVGSDTVDEGAEYITPVEPPPRTVFNDTSHEVTVEVRDRYNNPNASTEVDASVVGSGDIEAVNGDNETDSNGQVTFNYTAAAPSGSDTATLVFSISGGPSGSADERKIVNHTVSIVENSGSGGGGGAYTVAWYDPANLGSGINSNNELSSCSATDCTYDIGKDPTDNNVTLRAFIDVNVAGLNVDFGVNDTSVGEPFPSESRTEGNGNATTVLNTTSDGTVVVYAVSGGSRDRLNISVISTPTALSLDAPTSKTFKQSSETLDVTYSYIDRNPSTATITLDDGNGNTAAYNFDDSAYAGDDSTKTETLDLSAPGSTGGSGLVDGNTYDIALNVTDAAGTSNTTTGVGLLTIDDTAPTITNPVPTDGSTVTKASPRYTVDLTDATSGVDPNSITVTVTDSDGTVLNGVGTGNSAVRYFTGNQTLEIEGPTYADGQVNVTVDAADNAGNPAPQFTSAFTVEKAFRSATAYGVLPSTTAQTQSFTFTPNADIPSGTVININLDDPQSVLPLQVDYQGNANVNITTSDITKNKNADTATISITTGETVLAGETVRVSIGGVKTAETQSDPYDAVITRQDSGGSITPTFNVGRNTKNSRLTNLSVSNLFNNTNAQEQTIRFEPTSQLSAGESVSIDLSLSQDIGTEVDYVNNGALAANVSVDTLEFSDATAGNASIRFIPANNINAGETVEITVTGVNTAGMGSAPYEVGFGRGDAGTRSTTYDTATQAGQIQLSGTATSSGNTGKYEFVVTNNGGVDAEIVAVAINDTNTTATEVSANNNQVLSADGTVVVDQTIPIDGSTSDGTRIDLVATESPVTVAQNGGEVTFAFNRFRDGSGQVDMRNARVNVTFFFSDGSKGKLTIT